MIERITTEYPDFDDLKYTVNELVDAVNSLRDDCNLLMGYIAPENKCEPAENGKCAKNAQDETLKCPFCQQELHKDSDGYYTCYTDNCGCMKYGGNGASGSESLWLALIRTRKALDVAVDALNAGKTLADIAGFKMLVAGLEKALEQITAEQKDK